MNLREAQEWCRRLDLMANNAVGRVLPPRERVCCDGDWCNDGAGRQHFEHAAGCLS